MDSVMRRHGWLAKAARVAFAVTGLFTSIPVAAAQENTKAPVDVAGQCTLIVDLAIGKALVRQGHCARRLSPASTSKLPLAVMGFDAGILQGPTQPVWQYDASYDAPQKNQKPVDPTIWERESVLWYSRVLVDKLGAAQFARYVKSFNYGNQGVSGDPGKNNGLTNAWLRSSLKISADEQVEFVRRLLLGQLPVSQSAMDMTKSVIPIFKAAGSWVIHGKTGTTFAQKANGQPDRSRHIGWFVGWAEKGDRQIVFARVAIQPLAKQTAGPTQRDWLLANFPKLIAAD